MKTVDIQNRLHLDRHFYMKNFYNFSLNKSWVFHFTLAINHDFALYCLIIPIENGIINASKNFMCAWVWFNPTFAVQNMENEAFQNASF